MPTPLYLIQSARSVRSETQRSLGVYDCTPPEDDELRIAPHFGNWLLSRLRKSGGSFLYSSKSDNMNQLENSELQSILSQSADADVCLLSESPFRILRAAESGNLDEFIRLYEGDNGRLAVKDSKGRTAAHQAAARNRVNILSFIHDHGGDLNAQDISGNTPLHVAVENDSLDALEFLLKIPVATNILNEKKLAPVHLATELNKVKGLLMMGKYRDTINIQQGGEHGRTALHLAAIYDNEECARILISDFGACPRRPCNNGYYPIHEAAKNASSKTMEVFFQWGESKGCTREEMISFYDSEGNVPLHSAVHGGDIKAVELCLKSGAKISTQQHDLSTPVHLAAAQGAIEIVKLMFLMQPQEKRSSMYCTDIQKMTPLHCAAMFDHPEIVDYLVQEGADINALDKENRSPLLLSASRGGWRTVMVLIRLGANIALKDINARNVLHLVIINGGRLDDFAKEVSCTQPETHLLQLLNEKDKTGCSPLHYASREGHIRSLENLIRLGACINLKNNNNESPLHFAARYGRYNTVRQLLDSEKGSFIINESDGEGLTPLHIASKEGHSRVVQLLLNRGALLHRDHNGRNPLHLAAMSGYTQTIELLHSVHSHLLDQVDKDGNTALHLASMENKPNAVILLLSLGCKLLHNSMDMSAIDYAIYYKYPEAALAMATHEERSSEIMALKSDKHPCVTLALIASMPRVFEAVQDNCITKANCKKDSKSFYVGIYVVMFLEILQTLIKVLTVFSILIIAFGLSFYILLSKIVNPQANNLSFSSIPMSLIRTFSMMLGEIDFLGTYVQPFYSSELPFPIPSFVILCLFMILMPILLMNLLIGLAVGDIESVRRNAQLKRLAMQVVLHTELERKLPQMWLEMVDKMELIEYPNEKKCKLGFLDSVLRKWFCNPFTDDSKGGVKKNMFNLNRKLIPYYLSTGGIDFVLDSHEDYIVSELEKQKRKIREIGNSLDVQHQLLRLIVQKMEIKTEADDMDEGVATSEHKGLAALGTASRWSSPRIRKKLRAALSFNKSISK
ncbi:transient receptor potential cation channel subfamily A member 1 isoform X10 [Topomyia yanbarensis]|uniref:transient receptor potential cation channel subfamily A member 1 isoform X10 n=1 Tax=Topomyia yanbarensis TaxID=2498891 RepID=UPI00273C48B9|nr:transient receptor potential cation channel subfamily A member 1 isoform X10 [Topomyia yanbarensis]